MSDDNDATPENATRRAMMGGAAMVTLAALAGPAMTGPARAAGPQVYVIAELVAKPGKETELRELLVPFAKGAAKEPGCVHYTLMEVKSEPGRFLTYEIWADQSAIEAHMQTPEIKAAVPKLTDVLAKPFAQTFLTGLT